MDKEIRILIAEDSAADVELMVRELRKGGLAYTSKCVKSGEEFLKALQEFAPDIVLSDYKMPGFGAPEALEIIKKHSLHIPFVVVSGTIGEEVGIEMLKAGAADYIMKAKVDRLCFVIMRALEEAKDRAERKKAEGKRMLLTELLTLLNSESNDVDTIQIILTRIKKFTGFDAVGIRLKEGDDYPYYKASGFPGEFIKAENYLCARDSEGRIVLDDEGKPYLECMCGNIISGRTDPAKPFFTEGGSFWTNSTTDLLASTTEADRMARTRNRCNTAGYESVALIPIRSDDHIIGLLQLNDTQRGRFTLDLITFFEEACLSLGVAMLRKESEKVSREAEERFKAIFNSAFQFTGLMTLDGTLIEANQAAVDFTGLKLEDVINRPFWETHWWAGDEDRIQKLKESISLAASGKFIRYEVELQGAGDATAIFDFSIKPAFGSDGKVALLIPEGRDITERKKLEEEASKRLNELEIFYKASIGREERILELKKQVEELEGKLRKQS